MSRTLGGRGEELARGRFQKEGLSPEVWVQGLESPRRKDTASLTGREGVGRMQTLIFEYVGNGATGRAHQMASVTRITWDTAFG